jgi:hypothetical protein
MYTVENYSNIKNEDSAIFRELDGTGGQSKINQKNSYVESK